MRASAIFFLLFTPILPAADKRAIFPPGVKLIGPFSPGIVSGDYLYVSGQGAKRPDGAFPDTPAAQLRQCLDNIKTIVDLAGFTMDGQVYSQIYVRDPSAFDEVETAWRAYFPNNAPAHSTIGVAKLPDNTPVEVNAVLIHDPARKRSLSAAGVEIVLTPDRAYVSDCRGTGGNAVAGALNQLGAALKAAGLDYRHMVFVNPFLTDTIAYETMNRTYAKYFEFGNTPARATINVNALPGGASIEFTGIAVRDLAQRHAVRPKNMPPSPTASPCVLAGDTFYCSAKSGFIPGRQSGIYANTVETQVRQTMRNLLDGLEETGLTFADVVASNVYLDDMADFQNMNRTYKLFFGDAPPTRSTIQQHAAVERKATDREQWPTLEQISIVAVKPKMELRALSPKFNDLIAPGTPIETVSAGFGFTEGPVWDARGFLYISDEVTNKIVKLFPNGRHEDVVSLGDPDGNTYDTAHRLIDCASVLRAIIAVEPDGQYKILADRYQGKRFNSPNDVVLGPDGALYFTDPTLDLVKGEKQELPYQGVFRLGADGSVRLLIQDLAQPNGLAFSPDGKKLYVDDSERKDIHVYDVARDGSVSNGRVFGKLDGPGDPDGMRVDMEGNLYVTGQSGIWVWDAQGHHLGTIVLPEQTANLTWGDADYRTLYITSSTSVLKVRTKVRGFVPYE
jgi:gluconolactonase